MDKGDNMKAKVDICRFIIKADKHCIKNIQKMRTQESVCNGDPNEPQLTFEVCHFW